MHACPECGLGHELPGQQLADAGAVEASPAVVEAPAGPNEHDVEIARIESAATVQVARIEAGAADVDLAAEVERLRGELAGMRQGAELAADVAADPPAGPPIVVEPPAPVAEPAAPAPPPVEEHAPPKPPKQNNYFGF